jgi:hypothetical protein
MKSTSSVTLSSLSGALRAAMVNAARETATHPKQISVGIISGEEPKLTVHTAPWQSIEKTAPKGAIALVIPLPALVEKYSAKLAKSAPEKTPKVAKVPKSAKSTKSKKGSPQKASAKKASTKPATRK